MAKVIGIDLGTTNSAVAVMEGGDPVVIPNAEGGRITPSVVAVSKTGERLVGTVAKRQAVTNPENTIYSVKRLMGRKFEDPEVQRDIQLMGYKISRASNSDAEVQMGGRGYSPAEISAMILQKLKADAEAYLGEAVTEAVITVPAYFNDQQRQATKDAGRIAGLDVLRIINEPTAASLAYGLDKEIDEGIIAVYDLGGGTFDISILKIKQGVFEVLSTNGDTHLGGDDFDWAVMQMFFSEIASKYGVNVHENPSAVQRVKEAAEAAKIRLSSEDETTIDIIFDELGGIRYVTTLSRDDLEMLILPWVERTRPPCEQALEDAELTPDDVDAVVLVGGSTRVPLVRRVVEEVFKTKPKTDLNPDEVVALGAAIQASVVAGERPVGDLLLLDVTPLSLGIETWGGGFDVLIPRNTTIPCFSRQMYTTQADNQTGIVIHVLQGERPIAVENRSLARFILNVEPMPAGLPRCEVTFTIDQNGILKVTAKDLHTDQEQSVDVQPSHGLTDEEVEQMLLTAIEQAEKDAALFHVLAARQKATEAILGAERGLRLKGDELPPEERQPIETALAHLKQVTATEDATAINDAINVLSEATRGLAERLMSEVLKQLTGDEIPLTAKTPS
jgi:molecular chaperone DnaK